MNFKTTIFLLVMLLIVGGAMLLIYNLNPNVTKPFTPSAGGSGGDKALVTGLVTDNVTSLTIAQKDTAFTLAKDGKDWAQTTPVHWPVAEFSVTDMVRAVEDLKYSERYKAGDKRLGPPEQMGFSPGLVTTVTMVSETGGKTTQRVLRLGRRLGGSQALLMLDDSPDVYLAGDGVHRAVLGPSSSNLAAQVMSWRKHSLSPPPAGRVNSVRLTQPDKTIDVSVKDDQWNFTGNQTGRASFDAVKNVMGALEGLYVDKFETDAPTDLALYGLDKPSVEVQVVAHPEAPAQTQPAATQSAATQPALPDEVRTLRIGLPKDITRNQFYATWSGATPSQVVFTLNKDDTEKFNKKVDDFRDPRVSLLTPQDIKDVTLEGADQPAVHMQKNPTGWAFVEPPPPAAGVGFDADNESVAKWVNDIVNGKAQNYTSVAAPAVPQRTIRLTAVARPEPETLRVYRWPLPSDTQPASTQPASQWVVYRNQETAGYIVQADNFSPAIKPLALRQRNVGDFQEAKLNHIDVVRPDFPPARFARTLGMAPPALGSETQPSTQPATQPAMTGPWKMLDNDKFETGALDTLVRELTPLRAVQWIEKPAPMPEKTVSLIIQTGDGKTMALTIDPASRQATAQGQAGVFEVSRNLTDALAGEFRDRTLLNLNLPDLKQVTVRRGGTTTGLYRDDNGTYNSPEVKKVNQANCGGLFDTLAGLRVERFLEEPAPAPGSGGAGVPPVVAVATQPAGDKAALEIVIQTKDDRKITLTFPAIAGQTETGKITGLGDAAKYFRVSADTYAKLNADPLAPDAPAPIGGPSPFGPGGNPLSPILP